VKKISDSVLMDELKKRFNDNKKALHDLRVLTKKLEQLNRKLQESEATKSDFLSNIRNEINNPLTSIMGLSEQMFSGDVEAGTFSSMSQLIYNEAFGLDFQLKNIFMAAELEAGEAAVSVSNVDVVTFVNNLVDSFRNQALEKKLKVELSCVCPKGSKDEFYFQTDPEKLLLMLSNLLANAIEFSLKGKKVRIKTWKKSGRLNVSVKDDGIGIATEEQKKIFDRFRQLDSGSRKSHRGHGLGLSIVKALLELLGGSIKLSSVAGKGCEFTISIPESDAGAKVDVFSEDGNEYIF
jgi:signal transduction histidine kinase